ncbi:cytochrome c3 family protein [Fulvivirgaceae bacterium BMA12]|uniref:Cytochrome c3 family protein n=1 Tax=Agaribacillus aureus TaxID=3051825 RepID=A0ABT8KYQ7_9BACT|nr:cytochrome c3 family protein [Fulvivirgaceae bacterium BMA12]
MIKLSTINRVSLFFAAVISYYACTDKPHQEEKSHNILENIGQAHRDSIAYEVSIEEDLKEVKKVVAEVSGSELFYVPERHSIIKSFPCTNCHSEPLRELQQKRKPEDRKAHWNIKISHAGKDVMNCATCHSEKNPDELTFLTGKPLSVNHSYQLCGQCHTKQYKDWVGGAHGKRLGGWAPPKVIRTCVNCHDPHKPSFDTRWPARLNAVKLQQQKGD